MHIDSENVQSFWFGSKLSPIEQLSIKSFVTHGHNYVLYVYEDVENVPSGCRVVDARELIPRDQVFTYANGSVSAFSNEFRYRLLAERGGWWVDTDVVCLQPLKGCAELELGAQENDRGHLHWVNGAVMKAPAKHALVEACYKRAREVRERANGPMQWGQTGPSMLTAAVRKLRLHDAVAAPSVYSPIHWTQFERILNPGELGVLERELSDSRMLHLWNECFRRAEISKWNAPPRGSLLDELYRKYEVELSPDADRMCWDEVRLRLRLGAVERQMENVMKSPPWRLYQTLRNIVKTKIMK